MDTVWTTVKVRRSTLADAAEKLPGMSNAAIVQQALEQASSEGGGASMPRVHSDSRDRVGPTAPVRAPVEQITVDEALRRCPVCNDSLDDERRCVDPECSSHRAAS